jgi:WXG100 family type VII secretion target
MTLIQINPDEVERTGSDFTRMHSDVNGLVTQARGQMNTLRDQFKGARAQMILTQWDDMLPRLSSAIEVLNEAGVLLKGAARDFRAADMQ